jgi:hypothetical protein
VNVFSSFGIASGFVDCPVIGGMATRIGTARFDALFSDIYAKENNCMSGIAMFIVLTVANRTRLKVERFATIKAIRDIDIPVL